MPSNPLNPLQPHIRAFQLLLWHPMLCWLKTVLSCTFVLTNMPHTHTHMNTHKTSIAAPTHTRTDFIGIDQHACARRATEKYH